TVATGRSFCRRRGPPSGAIASVEALRPLPFRRPSPALVVAGMSLLVALGGTSVAAVAVLPDASVGTAQLADDAVVSTTVHDRSVTTLDVAKSTFRGSDVDGHTLTGEVLNTRARRSGIACTIL